MQIWKPILASCTGSHLPTLSVIWSLLLFRRVRPSRPASAAPVRSPHSLTHSGWIWRLLGIPPDFRVGFQLIVPPTAIGSVPSLSGHAIAYRWRQLPRVHRHRASSPQGSSSIGYCLFSYHHRGRPARSTQCMVQLPEVHPRTVRPTERSPRAQNPDAKSRDTRDNAVRLCHAEPARVPPRHAAPSPPQVLDSLHRLTNTIAPTTRFPIWTRLSRREVRALKRLYAGGGSCLRNLWRAWRIRDCQVRDVRRNLNNGGGHGLCGGPGKRVDGMFLGRSQSFRHQRRPVDDCSPGRGGMAQNGRTRGGIFFMAKWIVAEKTKAGLRHAVVRSPLLTSHKWREHVSYGRLVCRLMPWCFFSGVIRLFSFASFFYPILCFRWSCGPSFNRPSIWRCADSHNTCFFFSSFFLSLFPSIFFCTISAFTLHGEYTSYVLSFRMVFFLPCDHGLDFWHHHHQLITWELK